MCCRGAGVDVATLRGVRRVDIRDVVPRPFVAHSLRQFGCLQRSCQAYSRLRLTPTLTYCNVSKAFLLFLSRPAHPNLEFPPSTSAHHTLIPEVVFCLSPFFSNPVSITAITSPYRENLHQSQVHLLCPIEGREACSRSCKPVLDHPLKVNSKDGRTRRCRGRSLRRPVSFSSPRSSSITTRCLVYLSRTKSNLTSQLRCR